MDDQSATPKPNAGQTMGIAGLVLGIIAIPLAFIPCTAAFAAVPAVLAIIFGAVGLNQAKKGGAKTGLPIAGLVLGVISAIIIAVWLTLFAEMYSVGKKAYNELEQDSSLFKLDSMLQEMDSTMKAQQDSTTSK